MADPLEANTLKRQVLELEGALTIARAEELRSMLSQALENAEQLVVNVDNVTDMDLSALQLFCSAHHTSARAGKRITIDGNRLPAMSRSIEQAGYVRRFGCLSEGSSPCLWMEEKK